MSALWDTQNLTGQDPEKSALQLSCSEQETGLETSKAPFQSTHCHHSGVMNDSWANQEITPQTTSATTSINVLQGKNGSDRFFCVGSDSSHIRSVSAVLRQSNPEGPYPTVRGLLYWQSAQFSILRILYGKQL